MAREPWGRKKSGLAGARLRFFVTYPIILVLLAAGVHTATAAQNPRPALLVRDLVAKSIPQSRADLFTDALITGIGGTDKYRTVSRSEIRAMLDTLAEKQQLGACESGECLKDLGKMMEADLVVSGDVGRLGGMYFVSLSLLDMAAGSTVTQKTWTCLCDDDALVDRFSGFGRVLLGLITEEQRRKELDERPGPERTASERSFFGGMNVHVVTAFEVDGKLEPWPKMQSEIQTFLNKQGAVVKLGGLGTLTPEAVSTVLGLRNSTLTAIEISYDAIIVAVARGSIRERLREQSPSGKDFQFAGEIENYVMRHDESVYYDRYAGIGGWNPVGREMCLDVLALNVAKQLFSKLPAR